MSASAMAEEVHVHCRMRNARTHAWGACAALSRDQIEAHLSTCAGAYSAIKNKNTQSKLD
eukprot:6200906-Pleurochrysis_carterae.AAC.1